MSRLRFTIAVVVLAGGVFAVAFAAALQVLDDGAADPPPPGTSGVVDTVPPGTDTTTTASTATTTTTVAGRLPSPSWVTILASEGSRALAEEAAAPVADAGYPVGVLRSDDYPSLKPGLWVAFAGPYPSAAAARAVVDQLAADGFPGAYVRCAGTKAACKGGAGDG